MTNLIEYLFGETSLCTNLNKDYLENYRFAWEYDNPTGMIEGLRQFRITYEFVNKEELNPEPARKQKRND